MSETKILVIELFGGKNIKGNLKRWIWGRWGDYRRVSTSVLGRIHSISVTLLIHHNNSFICAKKPERLNNLPNVTLIPTRARMPFQVSHLPKAKPLPQF